MDAEIPVIAIDGPSASGKGTVAQLVADALGWNYLDSGALYRLVAFAALHKAMDLDDGPAVASIVMNLKIKFSNGRVVMDGDDVTDGIRAEAISAGASRVAALPPVREALMDRQRAFRQAPGLVADGRDMGSVVFPEAALKIFLTASAAERARRRHKQLMEKGMAANIASLLADINERDRRDISRAVAPLKRWDDAHEIDTTGMSADLAVAQVLALYKQASLAP